RMHGSTSRLTAYPPSLREALVADPAVPRMELVDWAERYGLVAGITTREHGFSLGLWSEENVGQVMTRWRAFRAAFHAAFPVTVLSHQIHGSAVRWHDELPDGWLVLDGVDGHATRARGVLLTLTVADCVPVYLAAPTKGAVALLLASGLGWPRRADGGVPGPAPRLTRGLRRVDSGPVSGRSSARAFFCHALRQSRRAVSGPPGSLGTRAR